MSNNQQEQIPVADMIEQMVFIPMEIQTHVLWNEQLAEINDLHANITIFLANMAIKRPNMDKN